MTGRWAKWRHCIVSDQMTAHFLSADLESLIHRKRDQPGVPNAGQKITRAVCIARQGVFDTCLDRESSITTGTARISASFGARMRATTSFDPSGGKPTTISIDLVGYSCAAAQGRPNKKHSATEANRIVAICRRA